MAECVLLYFSPSSEDWTQVYFTTQLHPYLPFLKIFKKNFRKILKNLASC